MVAALSKKNEQGDKTIWNSFKSGNKDAFATLYYQYFKFLSQKCFRLCQDKRLIEDCIHDLFLEIWSNKVNLVTPQCVRAYLLCSTQRKVLKQIKKSRNCTHSYDLNCETIMCVSIEEQLITAEHMLDKTREINVALGSITKRQREAISLRYFENLTYLQISTKMSISTDSVYNLISKALDNIQKHIQKKPRLRNDLLN